MNMADPIPRSKPSDICVVCPRRCGTHLTIDSIYNNWKPYYRVESEERLIPQYIGGSVHLVRDGEAREFIRRASRRNERTSAFIYWTHKKSFADLVAGRKIETLGLRAEFSRAVRGMKFIYVFRDARDVAVSFCFLKEKWGGYDPERAISHMEEWAESAKHWLTYRDDDELDILFISFELLNREYEQVMRRIGAFLGIPPAMPIRNAMIREGGVKDEALAFTTRRFRKGKTGDWVNYMGPTELRYFDEHCRELYEPERTLDDLNSRFSADRCSLEHIADG
jgi:hypothetical protein